MAAEFDCVAWYLAHRKAPVRSSSLQPEHYDTPALSRLWAAAQDDEATRITGSGLGEDLERALVGHPCPRMESEVRRSEARLVEEWGKRILLDAADKVIDRWQREPGVKFVEIIEYLREEIAVAEAGQLRRSTSALDVRSAVVRETIERWSGKRRSKFVPMGVHAIQVAIHGWMRGKLHIWAAPTSGHKTTFARLHATFAGSHGFPVVYFPLEDEPEDIEARSIVDGDPSLTTREIHGSRWPDDDGADSRLIESTKSAPKDLRYARCGRLTFSRMCSMIRSEAPRGLAAVFLDHIHMLKPERRADFDFWTNVGDGLAALAKELDIAVIATAQMDKQSSVQYEGGSVPTMSSVRFGGALTNPARSFYMTHWVRPPKNRQPESHVELEIFNAEREGKRVLKVVCEKNTNGPRGDWLLKCDPAHDRIEGEIRQ